MYEIYAKLRDAKGLTDYRVSKDVGISRTALTEWKKGTYSLKADKLQRLADYFGVSVDYLMTGEVKEGYYLNQETAEIAQELFDQPGMRMLFDAAKDAKPEDLQKAADFLKAAKALQLGLDNED